MEGTSRVRSQGSVNLSDLVPRSGERAVFLGQTGSGKTYLARSMLGAYYGRRQVIVLDSKHDSAWSLPGATYCDTLAKVERARFPRCPLVVWRPSGREAADTDSFDTFFAWLYARGNTVAVLDEVSQVVPGTQTYGTGFNDLVTRGRVRGLTVFYGTQRPAYVPRIIYSESQRFFVCYVSDARDRATIAGFTNPALAGEVPDEHGFWYYQTKGRIVKYFTGLDLSPST